MTRMLTTRRAAMLVLMLVIAICIATNTPSTAQASTVAASSNDCALESSRVMSRTAAKSTYIIAFKANGGKGAMKAQTIQRGKKTALSANGFTRAGYRFVGWNTKANGKGKSYKDKAKVKNLAAAGKIVKLYAQWRKSAIHELKIGKTCKKYDASSDGRADKVTVKGVAADNPAGGGVYRYLQVYVNGERLLATEDSRMPLGVFPTVKLVNLASGPSLLYVRYITHSGYYMGGWLYKLTSRKASLVCKTSDIARLYSSSHAGAYRTYELLESVADNELCFLAGSFSTDSTRYRYTFKGGKLAMK